MSTEKSCDFAHLLQVSKKLSLKSDFIHIFFMFLHMYLTPGYGLSTPWCQNFYININFLSLRSFAVSFFN